MTSDPLDHSPAPEPPAAQATAPAAIPHSPSAPVPPQPERTAVSAAAAPAREVWWRRVWVEPQGPSELLHDAAGPLRWPLLNVVMWPLALMLVFHRVVVLAVNGSITDDFSTVYFALRRMWEGTDVYAENYSFVDPHYLYNPGATLLLSPMAAFGHFDLARFLFIAVNAGAIILALAVLTRMVGYSLRDGVWPTSIVFAFLTEAVRNTLVFSNINGLLLLALCVVLWGLHHRHRFLAGVVLGLAIVVKPLFAPLLFLPFALGMLDAVAVAIAVPVVLNAIAWFVVPESGDYVRVVMPYLKQVRDYANSSLPGIGAYFNAPDGFATVWFLVMAALIIIGVIALLRLRLSAPVTWLNSTTALLLTGVFFLSSLGQMYYSMLLFPALFTVLLRRSVMHNPLAWLAAYGFLSPDDFNSERWVEAGRYASMLKPTVGWALFIVAIVGTAVGWWLSPAGRRRAVPEN